MFLNPLFFALFSGFYVLCSYCIAIMLFYLYHYYKNQKPQTQIYNISKDFIFKES